MDVRNHGIFFKEIYMQIYILVPFGVVLGDERKYILFPVFLLRVAGNPPHRRDRHLCSQELVLGPRTWQEASENKTKVSRGENGEGCFSTACEGTSYLGMREPPRPKTFVVHFYLERTRLMFGLGGIVAALISL